MADLLELLLIVLGIFTLIAIIASLLVLAVAFLVDLAIESGRRRKARRAAAQGDVFAEDLIRADLAALDACATADDLIRLLDSSGDKQC
ncbi:MULTISPECIES: hypothetical protein [Catenuloplanes]|uniref:Type II secretory pathway component PulJ n=1 Tax=Catenuloplanes niger TaxID=587534 RepID=A0AAE3ZP71_9ACTN|nr:hypothetical protein [Catenuloplanes niger]MDR7323407.1 type II secretory pathway component PulJ [Catenuloplanes niger]